MSQSRILIVHSDPSVRMLLNSMLQTLNLRVEEAGTDRAAVRMLEQQSFDALLAWADPKDPDALELLMYCRRKHSTVPVVLLYPNLQPDRVREALQWGAVSVLRFPAPANHLRAAVAQALGWTEVAPPTTSGPAAGGVNHYQSVTKSTGNGHVNGDASLIRAGTASGMPVIASSTSSVGNGVHGYVKVELARTDALVGKSPNLVEAVELAATIAPYGSPVLILGEPGTGKSLLAQFIHRQSPRGNGPFFDVDCGTMREADLDAELFGTPHDVMGGTGKRGKISQAQGGTLVLNQICSMPMSIQQKLHRVLERGELEPVGQNAPERVDVRFIFTSCENLTNCVEREQFRQDLYYRISAVGLKLPPLRHRGDDIVLLAEQFRVRFAREIGREVSGFTAEALEVMRRHDWAGNVMELENVIERAVVLCRSSRIESRHLDMERLTMKRVPSVARRGARAAANILPLKEALEEPERQLILQALEALNWNRQETARVLDINRTTLYKKMKKYGLLFDEPVWTN